jgi:4-hydroxy-tetrahydrodipicolinate reductase
MISLVLVGALGRMGIAIETAARTADDISIRARFDRIEAGAGTPGPDPGGAGYGAPTGGAAVRAGAAVAAVGDLASGLRSGDVVIDFSSPEGSRIAAEACAAAGAGLVSGTTGLGPVETEAFETASRRVAVLWAPNFSLGVVALRRALGAALEALPGSWDVEVVERHHRRKADSPSGTALLLAREAAVRRGYEESALRFGRHGKVGPRAAAEIGIHAVRGGTWVGDHAVLLAGEGEWLEIRHVAQDRAAFAHGALAAARFVARARPGRYTLDDLLEAPRRAT